MNNSKNLFRVFSIFFIFLFLLSLNFVSAEKIIQSIETTEGLEIEYPLIDTLKQNEDVTFRTIPINKTNGLEYDNSTASCRFTLSTNDGSVANEYTMDYNGVSFYQIIKGGNFSELGTYVYGIYCNTSSQGGFASESFAVTPSGYGGNSYIVFSTFVIILLYVFTFASFFYGRNLPLTLLGGMAMMFLGIYIVNNGIIIFRDTLTNYIAYITIFTGAIISFFAGYELYEDL